jgi:hypothetical protein
VAKQQQLIPACAPLMAALREEGYYLQRWAGGRRAR